VLVVVVVLVEVLVLVVVVGVVVVDVRVVVVVVVVRGVVKLFENTTSLAQSVTFAHSKRAKHKKDEAEENRG
jgi:hypothetical protein